MKKVIDGALYNTETAREIGRYSNGGSFRDFSHYREVLYRTKSGKYFLFGEGGPMTRYAVSEGQNSWTGGEHIEPMTPNAAREWAEEHFDADEYAAEFGEPDEAADGREALGLTVSAETKRKLEKMRSETGKSISALIDEIVTGI